MATADSQLSNDTTQNKKLGFGARLKEAREAAGLSGTALGTDLGETAGKHASRQTISDWDSERHFPSVRQLYLLCLKLGKSADELLFGSKDPFGNARVVAAAKAVGQLDEQQRADLLALLMRPVPRVLHDPGSNRKPVKQ